MAEVKWCRTTAQKLEARKKQKEAAARMLMRRIDAGRSYYGIKVAELAKSAAISSNTYRSRMKNPGAVTLAELQAFSETLKLKESKDFLDALLNAI